MLQGDTLEKDYSSKKDDCKLSETQALLLALLQCNTLCSFLWAYAELLDWADVLVICEHKDTPLNVFLGGKSSK